MLLSYPAKQAIMMFIARINTLFVFRIILVIDVKMAKVNMNQGIDPSESRRNSGVFVSNQ